ncbi:MAG: hypothetical protein ABFR89_02220 [Actinomycetota bacterium]
MSALVRVPDHPVNQRTILAVLASEPDDRQRVIFSATGFTPAAISIAETQGISLFALDGSGRATPQNGRATSIAPTDTPPAPFASDDSADDSTITAANWGTTEFPVDEWTDCPGCGVNQHVALDACRLCGTPLTDQSSPGSPPDSPVYRCRECGSHDVEIVAAGNPALNR